MASHKSLGKTNVCWIGGSRYTNPLNPTQASKWSLLTDLGVGMFVIGFADGLRPRHFTQAAHFYLLPELPLSLLRYLEIFLIAPVLGLWLVLRHEVTVLVTQSPIDGAIGAFVKQVSLLFGKRVSLIVENHGDFERSVLTQREVSFAKIYNTLIQQCARYAFHHADKLRAISSMTRNQVEAYAPGKPVEQFMTWTDVNAFTQVVREIPLSQTQDMIYTGTLIPRKGVHFLIDAFAHIAPEFPDAHLWLVGKPENASYAAQIRQQVEKAGLSARVSFVGALPQREVAAYMARVRVLILPSVSEGLGRVVVEAMLCGIPAIGSDVDGIPDMIQDGVNGYLVPPGDVNKLARALQKVLSDPFIETMGDRAKQFATQFFSPEAYLEGYRRLLVNNTPPPILFVHEHGKSPTNHDA